MEARLRASKLVAITRICLCGGWSDVGNDCNSAITSCNTAYMHVSRREFIPCAYLTGNVRVTNLAAPAVPRMLNPIKHMHNSNDRGAFLAENVGM